MQSVSATFLSSLSVWDPSARDSSITWVLEFYKSTAEPPFDPATSDFLFGLSMIKKEDETDFSWLGRSYLRRIVSPGSVNKKISKEINSFTARLSNTETNSFDVYGFERDYGFEGLRCVVRLVDFRNSTVLADSLPIFIGRCEKVQNFNRRGHDCQLTVKHVIDSDKELLRRTYSPNDEEGRAQSDPEFEGFLFTQRQGTVTYEVEVKKRFLFFFSRTKKETRTLQYSSHSDIATNTEVALICGRVQAPSEHLAFEDIGTRINFTSAFCDGFEYGITDFNEIRSVSPEFPATIVKENLGLPGALVATAGKQHNDDPSWVGAGIYSRTAYVRGYATGSELSSDDPAPDIVSILMGLKIPVPDTNGDFVDIKWSDNPVEWARWALWSQYTFGFGDAWHDDVINLDSAQYCDHILVDKGNTDTVLLPNSQNGIAGSDYKLYRSTSAIDPQWWLADPAIDTSTREEAAFLEAVYKYYSGTPYNSDDFTGIGEPNFAYGGATAEYRRRYTFNVRIAKQMKVLDFLYDLIFPSFNGYLTQTGEGKLAIKARRPIDGSFIETDSAVDDDEIEVKDITKFVGYTGKILIGAGLSASSEVRTVDGTRYSAGGQTITASGGVSSSHATLQGGTDSIAPNATLTVSTATGTKTVTIDGYQLDYTVQSGDTTTSVAGMIAALINSHPILNRYIKGTWNKNATVKVESKVGTIELASALEYIHDNGVADPTTAPTAGIAASGDLEAGTYLFAYSYTNATGETLVSNTLEKTVSAGQNIVLDAITPPAGYSVNWYSSIEPKGVRLHRITNNDGSSVTVNKASLPKMTDPPEPTVNLTAEHCHKIAFAFSDKGDTRADLTNSNMLKGSFSFPHGRRQKSVNQIKGKFRDASQDFELTPYTLNDTAHQEKVGKILKKEVDFSGIDNQNQTSRIAHQLLHLSRDGDFFGGWASNGEALLLEEYDPVCFTDATGEFKNEPATIEDIVVKNRNGMPVIEIVARKYRYWFYDDGTPEKVVRLPIVDNQAPNRETEPPQVIGSNTPDNTKVTLELNDFAAQAKFRFVELDKVNTFDSVDYECFEVSAEQNPLRQFTTDQVVEKTTGEASTADWYIRVSVSSVGGGKFSDPSEAVQVTFADSGGAGGVGVDKQNSNLQATWDDTAGGADEGNADLLWTIEDGTAAQTIQYRLKGAPSWTTHDAAHTAGDNDDSILFSKDASEAKTYQFRVKDNDIEGWSNIAELVIPKQDGAPSIAGSYDVGDQEVDLTATPDGGSGDYTFEEKNEGEPDSSFASVGTQASPTLSLARAQTASTVTKVYRVKRAVPAGEYSSPYATVVIPGTSTPPDLDSAVWDDINTELDVTLTNNGGSDDFTVQLSDAGAESWSNLFPDIDNADTSGSVIILRDSVDRYYDIRLYQPDTGYSNVIEDILVPGSGLS